MKLEDLTERNLLPIVHTFTKDDLIKARDILEANYDDSKYRAMLLLSKTSLSKFGTTVANLI